MPAEVTGNVTGNLGGRPVKVDSATYAALVSLVNSGLCRSLSECVRLLVKVSTPRVYQHEIYDLLERAKSIARVAGCERCSEILEAAKVMVLRMLSGHDPPCRLLKQLLEVVGCAEGEGH